MVHHLINLIYLFNMIMFCLNILNIFQQYLLFFLYQVYYIIFLIILMFGLINLIFIDLLLQYRVMLIEIFNYIFNFVILQIDNHYYYYFNNLNLILNLMFNYRIFYRNRIFCFLGLIRFFQLVGNILMVIGHVYRYVL